MPVRLLSTEPRPIQTKLRKTSEFPGSTSEHADALTSRWDRIYLLQREVAHEDPICPTCCIRSARNRPGAGQCLEETASGARLFLESDAAPHCKLQSFFADRACPCLCRYHRTCEIHRHGRPESVRTARPAWPSTSIARRQTSCRFPVSSISHARAGHAFLVHLSDQPWRPAGHSGREDGHHGFPGDLRPDTGGSVAVTRDGARALRHAAAMTRWPLPAPAPPSRSAARRKIVTAFPRPVASRPPFVTTLP